MRSFSKSLAVTLALALTIAVGGCGKKDAAGASGTPAKAPGAVRKIVSPADSLSPYMVAAVAGAKSGAGVPVQVKFELAAQPQVGDPLDIDLVILPAADTLERVAGSVQGEDGLDVVSGGSIASTEKPAPGTPIHHAVRVLPKREGIFVLTAVVSADSAGQSASQSFSIPVIAGNGLAEVAPATAPAPGEAKPGSTTAAR
jgi:hypothetical protein